MELINQFFIFSILGHLLENIVVPNYTSGILYGYWTPVYGIGAIIIILGYRYISKKLKLEGIKKTIAIFLIGAIFLSSIEYIGGTLIELIFNKTFWDYSKHKFNLGKYASLEMSITWGIASIALIYIIEPIIKKITKKIPKSVSYILIILFIKYFIATITLKSR